MIAVVAWAGASVTPAAAQATRVNATISVQVLRAAAFAVEADHDHVNIRADMDDTAASVVTHDARGETRMVMLLSRAAPLRVGLDGADPAPTYIQIMY